MKYLFSLAFVISVAFPFNDVYPEEVPLVHNVAHIEKELRCLELNIHHEARGESTSGKIAVGNVTLNRVNSGKFPNSVCKVVKQPGQFSWVKNIESGFSAKVSPQIKKIAYDILVNRNVKDITNGALFFHNKSVDDFDKRVVAVIGEHKFYR